MFPFNTNVSRHSCPRCHDVRPSKSSSCITPSWQERQDGVARRSSHSLIIMSIAVAARGHDLGLAAMFPSFSIGTLQSHTVGVPVMSTACRLTPEFFLLPPPSSTNPHPLPMATSSFSSSSSSQAERVHATLRSRKTNGNLGE